MDYNEHLCDINMIHVFDERNVICDLQTLWYIFKLLNDMFLCIMPILTLS